MASSSRLTKYACLAVRGPVGAALTPARLPLALLLPDFPWWALPPAWWPPAPGACALGAGEGTRGRSGRVTACSAVAAPSPPTCSTQSASAAGPTCASSCGTLAGSCSICAPMVRSSGPNWMTSCRKGFITGSPSPCMALKLPPSMRLMRSGGGRSPCRTLIAFCSIHALDRPGLYACTAPRACASSASAASASASARVRRPRWRVSAPNPPNDSGDCMPLASPTCSTRSQPGLSGESR
mmetsp:Transcript_25214/g.64034  ORF Transcript_25214/g.64034 Transcript_25214/m.64034 type:complete len:239 (+) Transcript_25214:174-890(+)